MMPDIDGFETCRRLKRNAEDSRDIPVMFMTALSDTSEKVQRLRGGRERLHDQAVPIRRSAGARADALGCARPSVSSVEANAIAGSARHGAHSGARAARSRSREAASSRLQQENDYLQAGNRRRDAATRSSARRRRCAALLAQVALRRRHGHHVFIHGETGDGQGADRARAARGEPAPRPADGQAQLQRYFRGSGGERAVRAREGCVHGRQRSAHRALRARGRRHAVPRRSRASCRWRRRRNCCGCCRSANSSRLAARRRTRSMCA